MFPGGNGSYVRETLDNLGEGYQKAHYKPEIVIQYPFNLSVGPTPPDNPQVGDVWIDTS